MWWSCLSSTVWLLRNLRVNLFTLLLLFTPALESLPRTLLVFLAVHFLDSDFMVSILLYKPSTVLALQRSPLNLLSHYLFFLPGLGMLLKKVIRQEGGDLNQMKTLTSGGFLELLRFISFITDSSKSPQGLLDIFPMLPILTFSMKNAIYFMKKKWPWVPASIIISTSHFFWNSSLISHDVHASFLN